MMTSVTSSKKTLKKWIAILVCILFAFNMLAVSGLGSTAVKAADANIAVGKTASADSGNETASSGNDGSIYTQWRVGDGNGNHWWKVDLGQTYDLSGSEVMWEAAQLYHYRVEVSSDNANWNVAVNKENNTSTNQTQTDNFTASGIRYVRIVCLDTAWVGMYELRVFGHTSTGGGTVATPKFSPSAGTYTSTQSVSIACTTSGATIRYTTDGSTPTATSAQYSTAINVSSTTTIKAIAVKSGMTDSAVASATYTINSSGLTYKKIIDRNSGKAVAAQDGTGGSFLVLKTFDGNDKQLWEFVDVGSGYYKIVNKFSGLAMQPDSGYPYPGAMISQATYAGADYQKWSPVNAGAYTKLLNKANGNIIEVSGGGISDGTYIDQYVDVGYTYQQFTLTDVGGGGGTVATPTFSPVAGIYTAAQSVTITCATAGAAIRYTIDGTTPTASSTQYTGPISVVTTTTIKAIGIKSGMTDSAVAAAAYIFGGDMTIRLLSQGKPASADSVQQPYTAAMGNDGSDYSQWRANDSNPNHYWMVDLGQLYRLTKVELLIDYSSFAKYKIQVSADGTTWATVSDKSSNTDINANQVANFTAVGKRYVRVLFVADNWPTVWECKVYGNDDLSPSSDNTLSSATYTIDNTAKKITNIRYQADVNEFKSNLVPACDATFIVKDSSGNAKTSGFVLATDTVAVTAQNGAVATYTLTVNPPSAINTMSSGSYIVDNSANTISGVPYKTDANTFKARITPAQYATFEVYASNGTTIKTGYMISGDKVICTAQNGGIRTYTVSVTPPSSDASLLSDFYAISGTTVTIPLNTSVIEFRSNISAATGATYVVSRTSGTMASGDTVVVTAQNETTTKTYTVTASASAPVWNTIQNDSFDNAIGNIELTSNWYNASKIGRDPDGNRYVASDLSKCNGDWAYTTDEVAPQYGTVMIKFKFRVGDTNSFKVLARCWALSEQLTEIYLDAGKLAMKSGSDLSKLGLDVPGGQNIVANTWYPITITINLNTKKYTAWVGSKPSTTTDCDITNSSASFFRVIEAMANKTDGGNGWCFDDFKVLYQGAANSNVTRPAVTVMPDDKASHVDVSYKNISGQANNSQIADTGEYVTEYNLSNLGFTSLKIKDSGSPDMNVLATTISNSVSPAIKVNGIWYKASNVKNKDHVIVKKAGSNMWEIYNRGTCVADDSGNILNALAVDQNIYFWNEKLYVVTTWRLYADIAGVEYAGLETFIDPNVFNKYNIGSGDVSMPTSGNIVNGTIPDQITLFDSNTNGRGALTYQIINKAGTESVVIQKGGYLNAGNSIALMQRVYDKDKHAGATTTWLAAHPKVMYNQIFVTGSNASTDGLYDTNFELNPLTGSQFSVLADYPITGSKVLGYDNTKGCYMIEQFVAVKNYFLEDKNVSPAVEFQFANGTQARKIRLGVTMYKNDFYLPGATGGVPILTDAYLVPNGIHVDTTKKWDIWEGWHWENYAESYSTFTLAANETKTMWHRWIFQNWGNKITVGTNVLDLTHYLYKGWFWLEQFQGVSEAYCALPDDMSGSSTIADVRAQDAAPINSGGWLPAASGVEFLKFFDSSKSTYVSPRRRGTGFRFDSQGPNLAQWTTRAETSDDTKGARETVTTYEIPGTTGTRAFHKIRIDFLEDMTFTNIQKELRFMSILDDSHPENGTQANTMVYTNASGTKTNVNIAHPFGSISWDVVGAPIKSNGGWAAFSPGVAWKDSTKATVDIGMFLYYVNGKLNGQTVNSLAVSEYSYKPWESADVWRDTAVLVPNTTVNTVKAGDYMELFVEVYCHGKTGDLTRMENEAAKWPYSVTTQVGTLRGNSGYPQFPAIIDCNSSTQTAEFTITGGTDIMPFTVDGFNSYAEPKLEEYIGGVWTTVNQTVGIKDGWQTDLNNVTGKYRFTFSVPTNGSARKFRVSVGTSTLPTIPAATAKIPNKLNFITGFTVDEQTAETKINVDVNPDTRGIYLYVRPGTNLHTLRPVITVVDGATIQGYTPGQIMDLSGSPVLTILPADGHTSDSYDVNVGTDSHGNTIWETRTADSTKWKVYVIEYAP